MGTTLTGTTPQDTYDSLIKVTDNGPLSGTAKYLSDGLGNDSALALSTSAVGIGTSSLFAELQVNKASDVTLALSNSSAVTSGNRGSLAFYNSGISTVALIKATAVTDNVGTQLEFYTRPAAGSLAQTMTIASTGNVGIGTSAPESLLHVNNLVNTAYDPTNTLASGQTMRLSNLSTTSGISSNLLFIAQGAGGGNGLGSISGVNTGTGSLALTFATRDSGGSVTERMRILSGGGITFNGDTAAANALDDYEEGTFTPTFAGSTTNPTVTYAAQSGFYTKIGRQVTITIEVGTSANTGGVGSLQIAGLPFTVGSRVYNCVATYNINNAATNAMSIFAEVNAGGTKADFLATGDNTTWAAVNWTDATNASIYINGSFTYFV